MTELHSAWPHGMDKGQRSKRHQIVSAREGLVPDAALVHREHRTTGTRLGTTPLGAPSRSVGADRWPADRTAPSSRVVHGERQRVAEAVVHVGLCCKVHDRVDLLRLQHMNDEVGGLDVALDKLEIGQVAH